MVVEGKARLENEGKDEEREEGSHVRDRVEWVGRPGRVGSGKPRLDQRARRREHQEGHRHPRGEQTQHGQGRISGAQGIQRCVGKDRQRCDRSGHGHRVDRHLEAGRDEADHQMRVGVAQEERRLVERETERPDRRCAAEPGQDPLAHHRLDQEDQESRGEDRRGKEKDAARSRRIPSSRIRSCSERRRRVRGARGILHGGRR